MQKEIISVVNFLRRGMIIAEGNHLCRNFSLLRDDYYGRKSSLGELFSAEGCILQKKIIPGRAFSCRGMHFAEGNHPCRNFSLLRDAFCGRKSSLGELFSARGMIIAEGNHPWESLFPQRDDYCRRKSSLGELFSAEGCISQKKIILVGAFLCRGLLCPTEK